MERGKEEMGGVAEGGEDAEGRFGEKAGGLGGEG